MLYLKKLAIPALIIAVGGIIVWYFSSSVRIISPVTNEGNIRQVRSLAADVRSYQPSQKLYGVVNPERVIKINAAGSGIVNAVHVRSGQVVAEGQLLVSLDQQDFINAVTKATSKIEQSQLDIEKTKLDIVHYKKQLINDQRLLELSEKQLTRTRTLAGKQNSSLQDLERMEETYLRRQSAVIDRQKQQQDSETLLKQQNVRLVSERSGLSDATLALDRSIQRAKTISLVKHVSVQPNSAISFNMTMVELLPLKNLEINATLLDKHVGILAESLRGGIAIKGNIVTAGGAIKIILDRLQGESSVAGQVGVFKLESSDPEVFDFIKPGIRFPIELQLPEEPNVVLVPYSALYGVDTIFLVKEGRLRRVSVKLLGSAFHPQSASDQALIRSSKIVSGDRILITHLPEATDELRVVEDPLLE